MIYEIIPIMNNTPLWIDPYTEQEIIWMVMDWYALHVGSSCFQDANGEDLPPGLIYLDEEPFDFEDSHGVSIATFNKLNEGDNNE